MKKGATWKYGQISCWRKKGGSNAYFLQIGDIFSIFDLKHRKLQQNQVLNAQKILKHFRLRRASTFYNIFHLRKNITQERGGARKFNIHPYLCFLVDKGFLCLLPGLPFPAMFG